MTKATTSAIITLITGYFLIMLIVLLNIDSYLTFYIQINVPIINTASEIQWT